MTYLSIEWPKAEALAKQEDFDGALIDAQDDEAEWLDRVPFGEQVDSDYFESPYLLMDFNDWFRDEKSTMDQAFVKAFSEVFMDAGLLHTDESAHNPINKGLGDLSESSEWLLGAMPPADVAELAKRAEALDAGKATREFQAALDRTPCEALPDGETAGQWIEALQEGLRAVAEARRGILVGMA